MVQFGYDIIEHGQIIGGDFLKFVITYDNRIQGQDMYAYSEGEAIQKAKKYIAEIYHEYMDRHIPINFTPWKDKNKWNIRIYN